MKHPIQLQLCTYFPHSSSRTSTTVHPFFLRQNTSVSLNWKVNDNLRKKQTMSTAVNLPSIGFNTHERVFTSICFACSLTWQWVQPSLLLWGFCCFYYRIKLHLYISVTAFLPPVIDHISWIHHRRWLVSYVTPLPCCTCIPITDILPLWKESLDFKKQRETNDRALSRTLQLLDTNQGLHFLPSTAAGKHQLSSSEEI